MMLWSSTLAIWATALSIVAVAPPPAGPSCDAQPTPGWPVWIEFPGQPESVDQPRRPQPGTKPEPRRSGALANTELAHLTRTVGVLTRSSRRAPTWSFPDGAPCPRAPPMR